MYIGRLYHSLTLLQKKEWFKILHIEGILAATELWPTDVERPGYTRCLSWEELAWDSL